MKKKSLLITVVILLAVLGVAVVLYPKLSTGMEAQLGTIPATEEAAEETTEETVGETPEQTEQTQPDTVPVPDFSVVDGDGNPVKLSDYLGKPVVLNFWAHWCGPCQMEMPEFHTAWEELNGEVIFLMLHVGSEVEEGKQKVAEGGYTFPVAYDVQSEVAGTYGITAFPTTLFIDAEGNLKAYYIGAMDRETLQRGIDLIYSA